MSIHESRKDKEEAMRQRHLMFLMTAALLGFALTFGQTALAAEQKVEFTVPGVI